MGKRKKATKKPAPKKKGSTLPVIFSCLFCNHEHSVTVKIDKKAGIGSLSCQVCGQTFQSPVNYLSAPVDVYYDWVDACDAVAKEQRGQAPNPNSPPISPRLLRGGGGPGDDALAEEAAARANRYEEDGFVVADEGEGELDD